MIQLCILLFVRMLFCASDPLYFARNRVINWELNAHDSFFSDDSDLAKKDIDVVTVPDTDYCVVSL